MNNLLITIGPRKGETVDADSIREVAILADERGVSISRVIAAIKRFPESVQSNIWCSFVCVLSSEEDEELQRQVGNLLRSDGSLPRW